MIYFEILGRWPLFRPLCSAGVLVFWQIPGSLGTVTAPDEASAVVKAIEFFCIEPTLQFRVVAIRLAAKRAKEGAR
jgi:hypothetical protein